MGKGKKHLKLSVHQLVDFLLREGDIDNRIYNSETMQLGSKIHSSFQKKQGNTYLSEVYLSNDFERKDYIIHLEGRADGIIVGEEYPIIDEIKSTVAPLNEFYESQKEWHLGQAKCYAYMYLVRESLSRCVIRLTYISQQNFDQKIVKEKLFKLEDLEEDINKLIDSYLESENLQAQHFISRNESAKKLEFPYKTFRNGQKEMSKYVYSVAKNGGTFFFEAPTGIGKTISTLYPAIKSFASTNNSKIFYLTAKTSGRMACYDAMTECYKKGFIGRDSLLVAKEKICFNPGKNCNPDDCQYARGYFGKLREIIQKESHENNRYNVDVVTEIAREYEVCPFELQLDLSLLSDVVICDYNYFFDPIVKLERYFSEEADSSTYFILADEAHNIPSRTREMFSATLSLSQLKEAKNDLAGMPFKKISTTLKKLIKSFESMLDNEDFLVLDCIDPVFAGRLAKFKDSTKSSEEEKHNVPFPKSLKDVSRLVFRLLFLMENATMNVTAYILRHGRDIEFHYQSIDPSPYLKEDLSKVKGAALFSATLSPIDYYMESILGDSKSPYLALPSPFPKENFHLMIAPKVSVRYKNREKTYSEVASYLEEFVRGKIGNYFLYFPSYAYLEKIIGFLNFGDSDVFIQERDMADIDKELFLSKFSPNPSKTTIGLLIIGGSFSEGIDLPADRLIGVAVVGIGLPQISKEVDLIRDYYEKKNGKGFQYAYMNPGMNKVMQAVGRLIRSENDVGSALLIDERYLERSYRSLFERTWNGYKIVTSEKDMAKSLRSFYSKKSK